MTTDEPWNDERVDAAFVALAAAHPPPPDLGDTARRRLSMPSARIPAWRVAMPLAATLGVLVLGIVGAVLQSGAPPTSDGRSAPPTTQPSPDAERPDEVLGLPVMSLIEALAVRDAGVDDRAIAVHAWFIEWIPEGCQGVDPRGLPTNPLQIRCADAHRWLTASEDIETVPGSSPSATLTLHPLLTDLPSFDTRQPPTEAVVIGHFDDRRAALCPDGEKEACRDRFVIDRVVTVDGVEQPLGVVTYVGPGAGMTLAQIAAVLAEESPDGQILSAAAYGAGLVDVEPSLVGPSGAAELGWTVTIWRIQVLDDNRVVTYLLPDLGRDLYRINEAGEPVLVTRRSGPLPSPSVGVWPPAGTTTTIALSSQVGEGQPPVEVAVVDRSGELVSAREVRPGDPVVRPSDADAAQWVGREPLDPRSLRLGWAGGVCDSRVTVTIETLESIRIDGGPQPDCDAMGVGREIILTFARPVDATLIELRYTETRIGAPSDPVGPTWREVVVDDPGPSAGWCAVAPFRDAVVGIVTVIDAGPDGMDQCSGVMISPDGEDWSGRVTTPFGSDAMTELVVVGARIVALGTRDGPSDANAVGGERVAWWSSDGRTWTEMPGPNGVVGLPWAISSVGDAIVATSSDGVYMLVDDVWRRTADLGPTTAITSSGAAAIAVRVEDEPEPADRLYWTPDGHQWTTADLPADAPELDITSLAAGRQRFVALGAVGPYQGQAPAAWWSDDGRTWSAAEVPATDEGVSFRVEDVADIGDGFVAHGWLDGGASFARLLWWSPDGSRWFDIEGPLVGDSDPPTAMTSIDDRVYLLWPGRIAVGTVGRP